MLEFQKMKLWMQHLEKLTLNSNFYIKHIPHLKMKRPVKLFNQDKWQERWNSPIHSNDKKYEKIHPFVGKCSSSCQANEILKSFNSFKDRSYSYDSLFFS